MNVLEFTGRAAGVPLGLITFLISFLRAARTFHPAGTLVQTEIETLPESPVTFHPFALARFSNAIWKRKRQLPDVLGISLRFSEEETFSVSPLLNDQDLLFASFRHPLQTPVSPFLTKYKSFVMNEYFSISPFRINNKKFYFKLTFENFTLEGKTREENLHINIRSGATIIIWSKSKGWKRIGRIHLKETITLNQEALKFNPFRAGLGIYPSGFVHALRFAVYPLSQYGRSVRYRLKKVFHKSHDRMIIERL